MGSRGPCDAAEQRGLVAGAPGGLVQGGMKDRTDARTQLTQQVLGAKTVAEIGAARQALRDWLTAHPDEQGMRWGFEQLAQMQEIAETRASQTCSATANEEKMTTKALSRDNENQSAPAAPRAPVHPRLGIP